MRFLGLELEDRVPDSKTVWTFRERLKHLDLIDATFVEVPKQRNTRVENALIKAGKTLGDWDKPEALAKRRQKDTDARWTKKNDEKHYGYTLTGH